MILGSGTPLLAPRLEKADSVRRPIGEERSADDPRLRDRAPVPAVLGVGTVVAHHVVVAARDRDRGRETARPALAGNDVGILLLDAVAEHVTVADRDPVAGQPDDPLDEGLCGLVRLGDVAGL